MSKPNEKDKTKAFDYATWPMFSYGNAKPPTSEHGRWTAWISAGGQSDAVICCAMSKPDVLALRKHVLRTAGVSQGPQARTENSVDVSIGSYKIAARLDDDGHLNLFVRALDGHETPIEIEPSDGISGDLALRFTLPSIEEKSRA